MHPKLAFSNSLRQSTQTSLSVSPTPPLPLSLSTPVPPLPLSPPSLSTAPLPPLPPGSGQGRHPYLPSLPNSAGGGIPPSRIWRSLAARAQIRRPRARRSLAGRAPLPASLPWPHPAAELPGSSGCSPPPSRRAEPVAPCQGPAWQHRPLLVVGPPRRCRPRVTPCRRLLQAQHYDTRDLCRLSPRPYLPSSSPCTQKGCSGLCLLLECAFLFSQLKTLCVMYFVFVSCFTGAVGDSLSCG